MRYWDNDFDRQFDNAIDELIKAENTLLETVEENIEKVNNCNPIKLYGAI